MRREIPLLITAIVGLFMILSFFVPHPLVADTAGTLKEWFLLIAAFAIVLGIGNLIRVNLNRIRRKGPDWGYKIVTLVALAAYAVVGLVLDRDMEIRASWITRSLGLVSPDREEVLKGQRRLIDRREQVAAVLERETDPKKQVEALGLELGFDAEVEAPDLVALGAADVRALDASVLQVELERALEEERKGRVPRRPVVTLKGRLKVTGIRPPVTAALEGGADRKALMVRFSFTWDQAENLVAAGVPGVAAISGDAVAAERAALSALPKDESIKNPADWVFQFIYTPLQATMFSLLAFFIASAAFRAFRMRTLEAGLLLIAGVLVIIGRVPLGQFDWGIARSEFGFHTIMQWIMNVPNTAAMRGIMMGAAMGVIVMGMKVILGIERSYLGGD